MVVCNIIFNTLNMDKEPNKLTCRILMLEGTHFGRWEIINYFKN